MSLLQFDLSNNTCNSPAYLNLIDQRRRAQLYNIPPPRYDNLANSPYTKINPASGMFFTKFDLDMRRKVEILKYSNVASTTKTNNLTRAQRWAQLVRGQSSSNYSQAFVNDMSNTDISACPMVYTSTTASDVPGPPILLYDASYVPLYNYVNDATEDATYGIINNPIEIDVWRTYPISNVVSSDSITSVYSIFNTLSIQSDNIIKSEYIYSVSIPFTIYIEANLDTVFTGSSRYSDPSAVQLWVTGASLAVFYSNTAMQLNSNVTYSLSNISYKSQSTAMNIAVDVSINTNSVNPNYNRFYAYGYAGVLNIANIVLPVQSGYIYDMQLAMNFSNTVSNDFTTYFGTKPSITFAYLNTTYETTQLSPLNCNITNPLLVPNPIPSFSLTGN